MERCFKLQYALTERITSETRYRTEQRVGQQLVTEPCTGAQRWDSYTYEVEVPCTSRICDVKLESGPCRTSRCIPLSRAMMGLTRCLVPVGIWPGCLPEAGPSQVETGFIHVP
jgi:hypothetical protein